MKTYFTKATLAGLTALAAATFAAPAQADSSYPNRPITFVVSFAPGGLSDTGARLVAAEMTKYLGQPIVIENKPGASGVNGGSLVWRAEPDGYTLLASAISEVQNLHYLKVPYKFASEFTPIGKIADGPATVLIVKADSPFKTLDDLLKYVKANPGKTNFATSGPATTPAIAIAQLNSIAKTDIVGVAYRGSGPAAAAVVSGDVTGAFTFNSIATPLVENKQVRILAVASGKRIEGVDAPTMEELGYKDFDHDAFVGLSGPPNLPKDVVAKLSDALNKSVRDPEFIAKIKRLGMVPPPANNSPEAFRDYIVKETARQGELAKLAPAVLNKK
ncbi:MAG TPA: tripartite tricarboxylate transporter substrate binding protein [Pseudolabrys sp.]|nr:tripartite tricarboxylate transporter substrate binding protein [Pseudolabrys sp.]